MRDPGLRRSKRCQAAPFPPTSPVLWSAGSTGINARRSQVAVQHPASKGTQRGRREPPAQCVGDDASGSLTVGMKSSTLQHSLDQLRCKFSLQVNNCQSYNRPESRAAQSSLHSFSQTSNKQTQYLPSVTSGPLLSRRELHAVHAPDTACSLHHPSPSKRLRSPSACAGYSRTAARTDRLKLASVGAVLAKPTFHAGGLFA